MDRRVLVRLVASAAMATCLFVHSPLHADSQSVVVGEISTTVGHEDVMPILKTALASELAKVIVPVGKKFVVSASLNKLDIGGGSMKCVISLALRDGSGSLRGILQGSAAAASDANQRDVVEAAVHGATKSMSEIVAK